MKPSVYAVKKAVVRPAGKIQQEALVVQLDGTSFGSAGIVEKIGRPHQELIAHVGISKRGNYVFEFRDQLWIRYMQYELSGRLSRWNRMQEQREKIKQSDYYKCHKHKNGRLGGYVHLWSGDISWGGAGKFALKPFEGEFREDYRA